MISLSQLSIPFHSQVITCTDIETAIVPDPVGPCTLVYEDLKMAPVINTVPSPSHRVKAAQTELGQQILADFEEAFPSQGTKVLVCILPLILSLCSHSLQGE